MRTVGKVISWFFSIYFFVMLGTFLFLSYTESKRYQLGAIVSSIFKAKEAGLKHTPGRTISTHSLRHRAGTLALRAGAKLRQVQDLLGHKDPRTTSIYTHVAQRWANNPALKLGITIGQ